MGAFALREAVLCFAVDSFNEKVFLLRGRSGAWNGFYCDLVEGRAEDSVSRLLFDEGGLSVAASSLEKAGELSLVFACAPEKNRLVHVWLARSFARVSSKHAGSAASAFRFDELPKLSWGGGEWLPELLRGGRVSGVIVFSGADSSKACNVSVVVLPREADLNDFH
ncbi:MAG: hypothetical protein ACP5O3_02790 [Candidatus Micrarchaeia archaeon]